MKPTQIDNPCKPSEFKKKASELPEGAWQMVEYPATVVIVPSTEASPYPAKPFKVEGGSKYMWAIGPREYEQVYLFRRFTGKITLDFTED